MVVVLVVVLWDVGGGVSSSKLGVIVPAPKVLHDCFHC